MLGGFLGHYIQGGVTFKRIVPFRLRGDSPTCHYAYNYEGVPIRLREVPYTAHCLISPVLELERPANTLRASHGHS